MKTLFPILLSFSALLPFQASAVTATFTQSNQAVTITGLGVVNGVAQARLGWGTCAFDGTNTNCTLSAAYTGVGGGGTLVSVLAYKGSAALSPFTANFATPSNNLFTLGIMTGNSGSLTVSLQENSGSTVTFLSENIYITWGAESCTGLGSTQCSPGNVALTPGATLTGTVSGTFDATPSINAVISASAYGGFSALAPSTWMEIYGTNLANVTSQTWATANFNGNAAPTALGATTVTIGGLPAYIDYVSPTQVNAQVPSGLAPGKQPVIVTDPGGSSAAFSVQVNTTEPGLLAPAQFALGAGQYVVALQPNGATYILPPGVTNAVPTARAPVGSVIMLYGIGFGTVTPSIPAGQIVTQSNNLASTVQIYFAGVPATVQFAGLVAGNLGLYQFNVVVPNVANSDTVPLTFSLAGTQGTQQLIIPVGN
jgi:uncharacterized protein (TIGR03437 family)